MFCFAGYSRWGVLLRRFIFLYEFFSSFLSPSVIFDVDITDIHSDFRPVFILEIILDRCGSIHGRHFKSLFFGRSYGCSIMGYRSVVQVCNVNLYLFHLSGLLICFQQYLVIDSGLNLGIADTEYPIAILFPKGIRMMVSMSLPPAGRQRTMRYAGSLRHRSCLI